jgi:hypothetical protein
VCFFFTVFRFVHVLMCFSYSLVLWRFSEPFHTHYIMYALLEVSAYWSAWYILFVFPYYDCHVFSVILYEFQCLSQILRHTCFSLLDVYHLGVYSSNKCEDQKILKVCCIPHIFNLWIISCHSSICSCHWRRCKFPVIA